MAQNRKVEMRYLHHRGDYKSMKNEADQMLWNETVEERWNKIKRNLITSMRNYISKFKTNDPNRKSLPYMTNEARIKVKRKIVLLTDGE